MYYVLRCSIEFWTNMADNCSMTSLSSLGSLYHTSFVWTLKNRRRSLGEETKLQESSLNNVTCAFSSIQQKFITVSSKGKPLSGYLTHCSPFTCIITHKITNFFFSCNHSLFFKMDHMTTVSLILFRLETFKLYAEICHFWKE